jgi:hypothetical protein
MKFEVTIDKKYAFTIMGLLAVIAGLFVVYAFNPGNSPAADPAVFGHSANEIAGLNEVAVNGSLVGGGIAYGDALSGNDPAKPLPCASSSRGPLAVSGSATPLFIWGKAECSGGNDYKYFRCSTTRAVKKAIAVIPDYFKDSSGNPKPATWYICVNV